MIERIIGAHSHRTAIEREVTDLTVARHGPTRLSVDTGRRDIGHDTGQVRALLQRHRRGAARLGRYVTGQGTLGKRQCGGAVVGNQDITRQVAESDIHGGVTRPTHLQNRPVAAGERRTVEHVDLSNWGRSAGVIHNDGRTVSALDTRPIQR